MSAAGFQGRGGPAPPHRGRKIRGGIPTSVIGARIPQPNYNNQQRRLESHGIGIPQSEYWLDNYQSIPSWQHMNGIPQQQQQQQQYSGYESQRYSRGGGVFRPQFCSGISRGRSRGRIRGESFDRGRPRPPGILSSAQNYTGVGLARTETDPLRFPPLGSEEERQKKIAETADKLKQKLSSLDIGTEPVNFWEHDPAAGANFGNDRDDEEHSVANKGIPELRHDPPELNLTVNDFKDIGRVEPSENLDSLTPEKDLLIIERDEDKDCEIWIPEDGKNGSKNSADGGTAEDFFNTEEINLNVDKTEEKTSVDEIVDEETKRDEDLITKEKKERKIDKERSKFPSRIEIEALKVIERKKNSELKLQKLSKSLEKLREVIKVDRELEKKKEEIKSVVENESRKLFQANTELRIVPPDVRSDYSSLIGQAYQRFQGFNPPGGPQDARNRFGPSFRSENPPSIDIRHNFPPEFQTRFDHHGQRNFPNNIPQRIPGPRIIPAEYGGPVPPRMQNLSGNSIGFDPREPPPRFNHPQRQDLLNNGQPWFHRNEIPQKYDNINGPLQPTQQGFHPRGGVRPPGFRNQDQEMRIYNHNIVPPSEFSQILPVGYHHVQHPQSGYFNPLNTAPCIIPKYQQQHSEICNVENQTKLQPPPIPTGALELQTLPPSSAANILNQNLINDESQCLNNQNHTPNMNEELEDMQEAMEFAKKLMNMTEEEQNAAQNFEMPTFPDLPPIPSTEPSHLAEKTARIESADENKEKEDKILEIETQIPSVDESNIPKVDNFQDDEMGTKVAFNLDTRTQRIAQFHQDWKQDQNIEEVSPKAREELLTDTSSIIEVEIGENKNINNRKNKPQIKDDEKIRESKDSSSARDNPNSQKEMRIDKNVDNNNENGGKIVEDNSKGRSSGSKIANKSLSASVVDANWKDKVINQFLKMSKNDICNMVNSSGLRKYDIAMKHLVKERKSSLSQERRCSADDAVKGGSYDMSREEFMSQLSAMLDPSATVDVKNLPAKFIQHLSEVLKLDVQSHLIDAEQNEAINCSQNHNNFLDNPQQQCFTNSLINSEEYLNERSLESQEFLPSNHQIQLPGDFNHLFDNIDDGTDFSASDNQGGIESEENNCRKVPTDEKNREIEGESVSHGLIRARCTRTLMSDEHVAMEDLFSTEISPKQTAAKYPDGEIGASFDSAEQWGGGSRRREDPDTFRNLSKEEWEARGSRSIDKDCRIRSRTPSSRETSISARSGSPRNVDRRHRSHRSRNHSPPTKHLREKNHNSSKANGDETDRRDRNCLSSSSSVSSDCDHRQNSSNVTKLLKVIKEREKIAKDLSLSETMRDTITAEIELEKEKQAGGERQKRRKERDQKTQKFDKTDDEIRVPINYERIEHQPAFIKQEELIIESDFFEIGNDPACDLLDGTKKTNSQSTADRGNEETLSEICFQETNETLAPSEGTLNTQEMLGDQEYGNRSTLMDLKSEFSHDFHFQSSNLGIEHSEIENSTRSETPSGKSETNETRIGSNKSGTKKIDIEAYKARKLKRNDGKSKEIETPLERLNIDAVETICSSREARETISEESRVNRSRDKCESAITAQDSFTPITIQREKNAADKTKCDKRRDRREERKPSRERSIKSDRKNVKTNLDERVDKKRSRTHSRDRRRSTSREDRHRSSRVKSKHHSQERRHNCRRSVSADKSKRKTAAHQNNNIVESKDARITRQRAFDSPKETDDSRIEKRHSRSGKNISEERENFKKRNHSEGQSCAEAIPQKMITEDSKEEKEDLGIVKDRDSLKEIVENVGEKDLGTENLETRSPEFDNGEKSSEEIPNDKENRDRLIPSASQNLNPPSIHQEKQFSQLASEAEAPETVFRDSSSKEDELRENKTNDCFSTDKQQLSESEIPKDTEIVNAELESSQSNDKSLNYETESLKLSSDIELEEKSFDNDIKTALNDLIEKAIYQLDLLNGKNEAKETEETKICDEIDASLDLEAIEDEKEFRECDMSSPATPESPLKGFSQESIESSMIGKRKLVQSVLEITENDDLEDEKSENVDDNELNMIVDDAKVSADHTDQIPDENFEQINSGCTKIRIETVESIEPDVFLKELDSTAAFETDNCVTPSGDTLSLGSAVDFDNGEFIVLSEISSEENFSHEEDRKIENTEVDENRKPGGGEEPNYIEEKSGNGVNESSAIDGEASCLKITQNETNETKILEDVHSELETDVKSSSKCIVEQKNCDNVVAECEYRGETTEESGLMNSEGKKQNLRKKIVENEEESRADLSSKLISKKVSVAEDDDNCGKKSSEYKKDDEGKKNLHGVKHRHKTKHKKDKKYKPNEKNIKEVMAEGDLVTIVKKQQTREIVMARMVEIDLEIHKLMSEKMKLYEMLESGELPNEQSLAVAKEGLDPVLETLNASRREPDSNLPNSETHASLNHGKQKSSIWKNEILKSTTKNPASCTSEEGISASQRDSGSIIKKSKKIYKHERSSRADNSAVQTESRKSSSADLKSSISRKFTEDKSTNKRHSHSRSSSRSNRRKDEETTSTKRDENTNTKKNSVVVLNKETLDDDDDDDDKINEKNKKLDHGHGHHHGGQKKKTNNKVTESREDLHRRFKKEGQISAAKDESESSRIPIDFQSSNIPHDKQQNEIHEDENSRVCTIAQEFKGNKKSTKGLTPLEETLKRDRTASRKRRGAVISKENKKDGMNSKSLEKSRLLSPAEKEKEEEIPLNLLCGKKRQKTKREPIADNNGKRNKSNEIPDHVLETINAVAENKTEEYHHHHHQHQRSNLKKVELQMGETKTKIVNKPIDQSQLLFTIEDIKSVEDYSDDDDRHPDLDDSIISKPISDEFEAKNDLPRENLPLIGNIHGSEMDETVIIKQEGEKWCDNDPLRLNTPETQSFDYISHFNESDSNFMIQDPTSMQTHSHSISRNRDIEKGLDVLDSMLETVSSDLELASMKSDVPQNFGNKKTKRKRKRSGREDSDIQCKKIKNRKSMTRLQMMNCSVRLIDCKYTHLGNESSVFSFAGKKNVIQKRKNSSSPSSQALSCVEFREQIDKLRSGKSDVVSKERGSNEEPENSFSQKDRGEGSFPFEEDYEMPVLGDIDGINCSYDDDDVEIMKLNSSLDREDDNFCSERSISELKNLQLLDKLQNQIIETIDYQEAVKNSPGESRSSECNRNTSDIEIGKRKSSPKLSETEKNDIDASNSNADKILEPEICLIGEQKSADDVELINSSGDHETDEIEEIEFPRIQYSVHKGPILDVKVFGDSIIAASEDGVVYRYSQSCNGILNTYEGHKSAVTCIYVLQGLINNPGISNNKDLLFSGSLDGSLRCFDIMTSHQVRGVADIGSSIQCMDQSWGVIFLGTKSGYVFRFHIKSHAFKGDEIKFSEESVLALKATTEGPRRVLIVASRSQPITIRDAQSGLFLRTVSGHKTHTVYSLIMDSNLVYCGTSSTAIPVFDFINGSQVNLYNAGPGIVCMRIYKWLLFAGCYDGNIYVFDTKEQKLVCSIPGPGNMLLSMDIVKNKIVAGSKDRRLHIWQMPEQVLTLLAGRT